MAAYTEKIAPAGFHILKKSEVIDIINTLGGTLDPITGGYTCGGQLKEIGLLHWDTPNEGATNESEFSAVGAGMRDGVTGAFSGLKTINKIWCIDDTDNNTPISLTINNTENILYLDFEIEQSSGLAVRLVMDTPETYVLGDTMTDLNGNIYPLIQIGTVVITTKNLMTTFYNDNSPIPIVTLDADWITSGANLTGAMCYYDNDINNASELVTTQVQGSVRLSDGFYPIGLKEYGGILYIISAKKPDIIPILFVEEDTYAKGTIVYSTIAGSTYYFESLIDNNTWSLPLESNGYWLFIGLEKDFINKYGFIEFGSYPSPEVLDASINDTSINYELINEAAVNPAEFRLKLYEPKIINESLFRAGTYVNFFHLAGTTLETTYVSFDAFTYNALLDRSVKDETASSKKIYKVKLYQQLTNGFIDLTDDVWLKYAEYVRITYGEELNMIGTPRYWFDAPDFNYYCPHNFKGKLAMSVELENYDEFNLESSIVELINTTYKITFNLNYLENTGWDTLDNQDTVIAYTTNGDEPNFNGITQFNFMRIRPSTNCVLTFADTYKGAVIKYKIRPVFIATEGGDQYAYFPQEFLDTHTISGSKILISNMEEYVIAVDPTSYFIDPVTGTSRTALRLTLFDQGGFFLDNSFAISGTEYQFYFEGSTAPTNSLGTYTLGTDHKAVFQSFDIVNPIIPSSFETYIKSLVNNTVINEPFAVWGTVDLSVTVNKTFGSTIPIVVTQGGVTKIPTPSYGPTWVFAVNSGQPFTISANTGLGLDTNVLYNYTNTITSNTAINFGVITKIGISYLDYPTTTVNYYSIGMSSALFGAEISSSKFTTIQTNESYSPTVDVVNLRAPESAQIFEYVWDTISYPIYTLTFNTASSTVYDNLTGIDIAEEGADHIFLKINSGLTQ